MFGKKTKEQKDQERLEQAIAQERDRRLGIAEQARQAFGEAQAALSRLTQQDQQLKAEHSRLMSDPASHWQRLSDIENQRRFLKQAMDPAAIEIIKKIKDVLDPHHILNPGKIWEKTASHENQP